MRSLWATGSAGGRTIRSRVDQLQLAERRAGDEHSAGAGVNGHRVRLAHGGQPSDHPGRWVAEVDPGHLVGGGQRHPGNVTCLLYTSDAADDLTRVDLG